MRFSLLHSVHNRSVQRVGLSLSGGASTNWNLKLLISTACNTFCLVSQRACHVVHLLNEIQTLIIIARGDWGKTKNNFLCHFHAFLEQDYECPQLMINNNIVGLYSFSWQSWGTVFLLVLFSAVLPPQPLSISHTLQGLQKKLILPQEPLFGEQF